jgi:hypothetical protein
VSESEYLLAAFSAMTGMRSGYFRRMRWASALRFSKGCCSLNEVLIAAGEKGVYVCGFEGLVLCEKF